MSGLDVAELVLASRWILARRFKGDTRMSIDRWLLIATEVLLPLWIFLRIVMLPAMLSGPGTAEC